MTVCTCIQHMCSEALGTVRWDGQRGHKWDTLVRSQSVHSILWYSGMGWTVGTQMGHFSMIPVRPFHPMVQWDAMDSRDRV